MPKGFEMLQFPTRGGQSADIYKQLAGGLSGGLPDILKNLIGMASGKSDAFAPQEKQAMDFFNQQLAPGIAQRYAGSGIGASSGMQNAIAGAAGNLTTNLQAQRNKLMQQSMHDVLNLGNLLLGKPDIENYFRKQPDDDFWSKILGIGLPIGGAALGGTLGFLGGGPMGALTGAQFGGSLGGTASKGFLS